MTPSHIPVSVIVPSYNSGNYLKECIDSINSGCMPVEILIIDDCSSDDSLELAFKLKSQYVNIKVIQRDTNGGSLAARKSGIFEASQELIAFVDADDILEVDALGDAYAVITSSEADICIWDLWRFNAEKKWRHESANPKIFPKSGREAVMLTLGGWGIHPLGISYKSIYIKAYQDFSESGTNADELLTRLVFSHANMVVGCEKKYLYRDNVLSTSRVLNKNRLSSLDSCLWLLDFARDYSEASFKKIVLNGIGEAWFYWKNRNRIGNVETRNALRIFLPEIFRLSGLWFWLWQSPKHFIALIFLSVATLGATKKSYRADDSDNI